MNLLEVTGLKKVYTQRLGAKPNVALRNVSFSAAKGEYIAIMGERAQARLPCSTYSQRLTRRPQVL